MENQLKEIIRLVVRKDFMNELSKNDVHVKEIMKFYDKGTYSTKKAVSIFVSGKTNATRNQILDDLGDMGYNDAWEVMDHFKLKIESVNEAAVPTGERIQKLNNRIKALRDKLSATKSPEQKKLFQDRLKNALQTLSNIKKDYGIKKEISSRTPKIFVKTAAVEKKIKELMADRKKAVVPYNKETDPKKKEILKQILIKLTNQIKGYEKNLVQLRDMEEEYLQQMHADAELDTSDL
jgi:hypothetical protein